MASCGSVAIEVLGLDATVVGIQMLAGFLVGGLRYELDGVVTSRTRISCLSLCLVVGNVSVFVLKVVLSTVRLLSGLFLLE